MSRVDEIKEEILEYFKENESEFNEIIEDLDSWCGYLGDDRIYGMEELDELYYDMKPVDVLYRAFYGHDDDTYSTDSRGDREYGEFNPNRNYFYFNGYGNLVSTDFKDYSSQLDMYFVEKVIDEANNLNLPEEVWELIKEISNEEESEDEEDV